MAELLADELGIGAELVEGHGGIFEVLVDGVVVARKTHDGFPLPSACVTAVRDALRT